MAWFDLDLLFLLPLFNISNKCTLAIIGLKFSQNTLRSKKKQVKGKLFNWQEKRSNYWENIHPVPLARCGLMVLFIGIHTQSLKKKAIVN